MYRDMTNNQNVIVRRILMGTMDNENFKLKLKKTLRDLEETPSRSSHEKKLA